jgi:hypothetical protein
MFATAGAAGIQVPKLRRWFAAHRSTKLSAELSKCAYRIEVSFSADEESGDQQRVRPRQGRNQYKEE